MVSRRRKQRQAGTQYELGRGAVYSRVSNPGDTREASLETQEQGVITRLREQGYTCGPEDVFRDKFTGKETIRRPALNLLRQRIRDGTYKAVGVYKLDRLARNMGHSFILLSEMDELGVRPLSVLEPNIDDSPVGKLYRMMGSYMAEAELATLEDRFGRGREFIAAKGLPLSRGVKAYGLIFDKPTRAFQRDEDGDGHEGTAKWAERIFELAAKGASGHEIACKLNTLGVKPPGLARGLQYRKRPHTGLWSGRQVCAVIRNPIYKGWCVEGKYFSEGVTDAGHSIMRRAPEDEWVVFDKSGAIAPRLIPESVWDAANRTLDANARNVNSHGRKEHDYLLRGMVYCCRCGAKRYGLTNQHGNIIYRCSNSTLVIQKRRPESCRCVSLHVRGHWIEPLVWEQLRRYILTPDALESAITRMLAGLPRDSSEGDLAMAKANLAEQKRVREKFYMKWREEESRADADPELAAKWEADYRALKGPIDSLARTVASLEEHVAALVSPEVFASQATERFRGLRERLLTGADLTTEEKRDALLMARTRVVVEGNGRRKEGLSGGTGTIHFYLFEEGDQAGQSPARSSRMSALKSIDITIG